MTGLMTSTLFPDGVRAVNVGLEMFAQPLADHGATVVSLEWRPPAEGDRDLGLLLARLEDDPDDRIGRLIMAAKATAKATDYAIMVTVVNDGYLHRVAFRSGESNVSATANRTTGRSR